MEGKENRYYSLRVLFLTLIVGILMGLFFSPRMVKLFQTRRAANEMGEKVRNVMELVASEYVDEIDNDSMTLKVTNAIMSSLDPHSRYIGAEELQRELADIRGNFEGIGAMLRSDNDTVSVAQTLGNSPAYRAGLRTGDRIITVDGDTVSGCGMALEEVIKRIRGPHGVPVTLGIMHYGSKTLTSVEVKRDVITTNSVAYSGMVDSRTGYIRLTRFSETSYDEVRSALRSMEGKGMRRVVLDLRNNGGGLLEAAILIANEFLGRGDLIVYTQGAHQRRNDVRADGRGGFQDVELVVMIDEMSASASEVVSGAVQDNDRGIIVGRRSFGKGLVQRQFDLSDGSAVWLTVARYYTPSGRCIQRPYDKGTDEYYSEYLERILTESMSDSLLVKNTDTTPYYTVKGRKVFGGGGIYPDHLLPYYRDSLLAYYNQLANHRVIDRLAFRLVATEGRKLAQKYKTAEEFIAQYTVDSALHQRIIDEGEKAGVKRNDASIAKYGRHIDTLLKAYMAEYLFDVEAFYMAYASIDTDLQATLKYMDGKR